jgi:cytoskeletal protein RodZ
MSDAPTTDPVLAPPSPGQQLTAARNARHLSIDELSQRTKISTSILRAIEEDRYEALPRVRVYVRGFIRSFAVAVGIEPDPITAQFLDAWEHAHATED